MNEENDMYRNVEGDAVDLVDCVHRQNIVLALKEMKIGKAMDLQIFCSI